MYKRYQKQYDIKTNANKIHKKANKATKVYNHEIKTDQGQGTNKVTEKR